MAISFELRQLVIRRAGNRCEYCQISQAGQEATFHIDHIIPISFNGPTVIDNLALACVSCSLRKGARREIIDRESDELVPVFHPRNDRWGEHFIWKGPTIIGKTPTGRAMIAALQLNREIVISIRREEIFLGRHPPY